MFKSIFADQGSNNSNQQPIPHLQQGIKAREKTLKNLQDKVHYEQNILENKNPSLVSVLMKEYKNKVTALRLDKMKEELKVKSSNFQSIFSNDEVKEEQRQKTINEKMREEYFQNYVLKPREQENVKNMLQTHSRTAPRQYGDDYKVRISGPQLNLPKTEDDLRLQEEEVLRMNQLNKQYEMYHTMLGDLFIKNEELIEKNSNQFVCKNQKILNALEPIVLGSMSVFTDDITEALLDELLEESVVYMNRLEEYKENVGTIMNRTEKNHEELVPEVKKKPLPYHVIKALKALDEYADDD